MRHFVLGFIFLVRTVISAGSVQQNGNTYSSDVTLLATLTSSKFGSLFENLADLGLGHDLENTLGKTVNKDCLGHTLEWIFQLANRNKTTPDLWALHMIDAFANLPDGILSGHINSFGDYDECVRLRAKNVNFSWPIQAVFRRLPTSFGGQYCSVYLVPQTPNDKSARDHTELERISRTLGSKASADPVSPQKLLDLMSIAEGIFLIPSVGVCLPSSCSSQDVGNLTTFALSYYGLGKILAPNPIYCTTGTKPDLDVADISVLSLLGGLLGLCLFAAMVDMWMNRAGMENRKDPGLALQYLLAFSLYTNIRKWLTTQSSGDDLGCIHGIRVLSTTWVILGHTYYMITFIPSWNMAQVKQSHDDWTLLTVLNSTISVDTFFIMSGMLVSYNLLKLLDKNNGTLNLPMFYIHRYLRITPTYALLIGIMATIIPYLGSGPFWFWMDRWSKICEENWWTNLIYVNNFVNTNRLCQGEAWYLACDMQFYILSPLFIYPLWRWKKVGFVFLGISTIASILCPALLVYYEHVVAPTTIPFRAQGDWFQDIYIKPYARIQTYLVGVALGYILFIKKGKRVHMSKVMQLSGWTLAVCMALSLMYGIQPWFNPRNEIPRIPGAVYAGLNRFAWSLSVAWVIFACVKGYGGLINDFLSWKVFIPLGRLCFCVFLVSLHLQMILHLSFRQPITYAPYTMTNFFLAHIMMSFMVGFICTLTLESPFIIVEKLIFEGGAKPKREMPAVKEPPPIRYGIFYQKQETVVDTEQIVHQKNSKDL